MNRNELKQLAEDRIEDSRILLDNGRWSAAYYLVGYALETALKACILRFVEESGVIFTDRKFAERCWTHRIEDLLKHANLEPELGMEMASNFAFSGYWGVAKTWEETSRYQQKSEADARVLFEAVSNDPDGVFKWLQQHW